MSQDRFIGRAGVGGPNLVGMNKAKDPSTIADNEHAEVVNMRVKGASGGGILVSRGGQSKVNDTAAPGCIEGIFPIDDPYPYEGMAAGKMWFNSRDNLFSVDPGTPVVQEDPPFHPSLIIGHHDGAVWLKSPGTFGGFGAGYRVSTITDDSQSHTVLFDPNTVGATLGVIYGETFKAANNDILIPCRSSSGGGGTPFVVAWDGFTALIDYIPPGISDFLGSLPNTTTLVGPFFTLADGFTYVLVAGTAGTQLSRRTAVGTWVIVVTSAVPWVAIGVHAGLLYGGSVYNAATGGFDITTWDGSAAVFTLVHTIPVVAQPATPRVVRIFSFGGKLWYLYAVNIPVVGGLKFILGCYDGTTWDDEVFTFTNEISVGENVTTVWMAVGASAVRGTPQVPFPSAQAYCAASQNANLAWFFAQNIYPNPQSLYLHTDSGQRSKYFYFVD